MFRLPHLIISFIVVTVLLSFGNLSFSGDASFTVIVEVNWVSYSTGFSFVTGLCSHGDYLYVIGGKGSIDTMWVVEARSKIDGGLVKTWTFNPTNLSDLPLDCLAFNSKLYIVGYENLDPMSHTPFDTRWSIIVLDPDLNMLQYESYNPSPNEDRARVVESDGQRLYVIGTTNFTFTIVDNRIKPSEEYYLVEIRDPETLAIVKSLKLNGSIYNAKFNEVTGELWVIGFTRYNTYDTREFISMISRDLEQYRVVKPPIEFLCYGLAFDSEGNAYVTCKFITQIAKLNRDGELIKSIRSYRIPGVGFEGSDVSLYDDYVILAGSKFDLDLRYKPAIRILDKNLTVITEKILEPGIEYDDGYIESMVLEGDKVYIVGYLGKDLRIVATVIYSITINTPTTPVKTVTQTITLTITQTTTTVVTQTVTTRETVTHIETLTKHITVTHEKTVTYRETLTKEVESVTKQQPETRNLLVGTIIGVVIGVTVTTLITILTRKQRT